VGPIAHFLRGDGPRDNRKEGGGKKRGKTKPVSRRTTQETPTDLFLPIPRPPKKERGKGDREKEGSQKGKRGRVSQLRNMTASLYLFDNLTTKRTWEGERKAKPAKIKGRRGKSGGVDYARSMGGFSLAAPGGGEKKLGGGLGGKRRSGQNQKGGGRGIQLRTKKYPPWQLLGSPVFWGGRLWGW